MVDQAKQVVLIGDDKQLGPMTEGYVVHGASSLFERLFAGRCSLHAGERSAYSVRTRAG